MRALYSIFSTRTGTTAALSVLVLLGAIGYRVVSLAEVHAQATSYVAAAATPAPESEPEGADWQQEMALLGQTVEINPSATSSNDTLAMIGPMVTAELIGQYAGLQSNGTFSSSTANAAAQNIASNMRAIVSYKTYDVADIKTDSDISYRRMLQYRADLRDALAPLLRNTNAELDLYAKYVETSDPSYLTQLSVAAKNYHAAADAAAALTVPRDAVNYHRAIVNAMQEFAAVLDAMTTHTTDSLTSAAMLRSYNQAETDMLTSFNNLSAYYAQKTP